MQSTIAVNRYTGEQQFRVLVADPPWQFGDKLPGSGRGADKHYATLSLAQLERFPLPEMAYDSLLFMWRVSAMVPEAYQLVNAWGYTAKSEIVWQKTTATGKPWFGMGRYVRASHETCIVAARGRATSLVKNKSIRSTFSAPAGRHSEKPDAFYELVERLADGPYAELFARRMRTNWNCFGNEVGTPVDMSDVTNNISLVPDSQQGDPHAVQEIRKEIRQETRQEKQSPRPRGRVTHPSKRPDFGNYLPGANSL